MKACAVPLIVGLFVLSACGLPRAGPTQAEVENYGRYSNSSAVIVPVNLDVAQQTRLSRKSFIPASFSSAKVINTDQVFPGDILSISIYENVDDGLLGSNGIPAEIVEIQVEGAGLIFLPYVGRVKATGKTTEQLRLIIERKLQEQTPDPQVIIRRTPGEGATVSLVGSVTAQGIYPIQASTGRLSGLLAKAGGLSVETNVARIVIKRGGQQGIVWATDLFASSDIDIALRPNDRILVEEDPRQFVALGAVGGQTLVRFDSDEISLIEAMGMIGGLNASTSNPSGVFVFRKENSSVAQSLDMHTPPSSKSYVVYVLDMKNPESVFAGGEFYIRDDDVIYVTEAPFTQLSRVIDSFLGTATSVQSASSLTN